MKFLKKAIPLCLLALVLVIGITLLTPKAQAATKVTERFTSGDYTYVVFDGKATIIVYTGSETNLKIPANLDGFPVTGIGYAIFADFKSLTSVTIPDGVTTIDEYAFMNCTGLTSITIPASVTVVDSFAFASCYNLDNVYFAGTQVRWSAISFGFSNESLTKATIHYNHTHYYTALTIAPTCTEPGYIEYTCRCDEFYREELTPLGHNYTIRAKTFAPTCTKQGYTLFACPRCGLLEEGDYVPALGHDFSGAATVIAPGCAEQGYTETRCIRCEAKEISDYTASLGHNVVVISRCDPTCTEQGVSKIGTMCDRCQEVFAQPTYIPALGHSFVDGVCTVCLEENPDYVRGDLTGDNFLNNADVIVLMWHVLFPENYPISDTVDYDHNGQVENNDIILLMWYILFPELYPLN